MSNQTDALLEIDLNELDEPHKLSKWILLLPNHIDKSELNTDIDYNHTCKLFSQFMYESCLSGHHIKNNFHEDDFKEILDIIHGTNKYDYSHFEWIWKIIEDCQLNDGDYDDDEDNQKLNWIRSKWKRCETLNKLDFDDDIYEPKNENENDDHYVQMEDVDEETQNKKQQINDQHTKTEHLKLEDEKTMSVESSQIDESPTKSSKNETETKQSHRERIDTLSVSDFNAPIAPSDILPPPKNGKKLYGPIHGTSVSDSSVPTVSRTRSHDSKAKLIRENRTPDAVTSAVTTTQNGDKFECPCIIL